MARFLLLLANEFKLARTAIPIHVVAVAQPSVLFLLISFILVHPTFEMNLTPPSTEAGRTLLEAMARVDSPAGVDYIAPVIVDSAGLGNLRQIVMVEERNGVRELIVPGPDGTEIRGTLDSKNLPTHVEWRIGGQIFSGDYADYKDFQEYGVMFPVRIVEKIDGREIANLTVSDSLANPYLIFPPPKEVKPSP